MSYQIIIDIHFIRKAIMCFSRKCFYNKKFRFFNVYEESLEQSLLIICRKYKFRIKR